MSRVLIVMAKAPLPGLAKTRLQRETGLSLEDVARLADAFVRDTLAVCAAVDDARTLVCHAPPESAEWFRAVAPAAVLAPQVEGDLGQRMRAAFEVAFAGGATRAVMIGTDAPHLAASTLRTAFEALERADCVLGPAEDGGYVLIGLRRPCPGLLTDIAWSTDRVLEQTLERARDSGVRCEILPASFDVDGAADLERLARLLDAEPERCPETARVLAELGGRGGTPRG
ncbi:MAG: TIGR04282 family arsenosugar biosynthesis glycosyltransferase [Planctomycetota bacterium]|nr:TIGR04282 family arsenosugar biosynthesis glycosyltransferase [Planctomycetota bacterium]